MFLKGEKMSHLEPAVTLWQLPPKYSEVVKKLAAVNGQAIGNVRLLHHERTICSVSVAP